MLKLCVGGKCQCPHPRPKECCFALLVHKPQPWARFEYLFVFVSFIDPGGRRITAHGEKRIGEQTEVSWVIHTWTHLAAVRLEQSTSRNANLKQDLETKEFLTFGVGCVIQHKQQHRPLAGKQRGRTRLSVEQSAGH